MLTRIGPLCLCQPEVQPDRAVLLTWKTSIDPFVNSLICSGLTLVLMLLTKIPSAITEDVAAPGGPAGVAEAGMAVRPRSSTLTSASAIRNRRMGWVLRGRRVGFATSSARRGQPERPGTKPRVVASHRRWPSSSSRALELSRLEPPRGAQLHHMLHAPGVVSTQSIRRPSDAVESLAEVPQQGRRPSRDT